MKRLFKRPPRRFVDQSYAPKVYNLSRQQQRKQPERKWKKTLSFFKEWGGTASICIALVYTFPLEIADRKWNNAEKILKEEEKSIKEVRRVLSDGSSLMISKTLDSGEVSGPRELEMISDMYNSKFFNLINSNQRLLKENIGKIYSSEIGTFAKLLGLSGLITEAISFYEDAIKRAEQENIQYPSAWRDKAQLHTYAGINQSIKLARNAYVKSLSILSRDESSHAKKQFVIYLSELARVEATLGDRSCGIKLYEISVRNLESISQGDRSLTDYISQLKKDFSELKQSDANTIPGCSYSTPAITI